MLLSYAAVMVLNASVAGPSLCANGLYHLCPSEIDDTCSVCCVCEDLTYRNKGYYYRCGTSGECTGEANVIGLVLSTMVISALMLWIGWHAIKSLPSCNVKDLWTRSVKAAHRPTLPRRPIRVPKAVVVDTPEDEVDPSPAEQPARRDSDARKRSDAERAQIEKQNAEQDQKAEELAQLQGMHVNRAKWLLSMGMDPAEVDAGDDVEDENQKLSADIALANEHMYEQRFGAGKESLLVPVRKLGHEMGIGIPAFFMLVESLGIYFLQSFLVSIPALLMHYGGNGILRQSADAFGLVYWTLGNNGRHKEHVFSSEYCQTHSAVCSGAAVDVFDTELATEIHTWIVCSTDFVCCMLFCRFIFKFHIDITKAKEHLKASSVTPRKFAVMVWGLPADATEEQIRCHFDIFGDLSDDPIRYPHHCGCIGAPVRDETRQHQHNYRGGQFGDFEPVQNLSHINNNIEYSGSWVAEVSIAHPIGHELRALLASSHLSALVNQARSRCTQFTEKNDAGDDVEEKKRLKNLQTM